MSQYKVIIKEEAQADLKNLLRYEPKAYKKAIRFMSDTIMYLVIILFCADKFLI